MLVGRFLSTFRRRTRVCHERVQRRGSAGAGARYRRAWLNFQANRSALGHLAGARLYRGTAAVMVALSPCRLATLVIFLLASFCTCVSAAASVGTVTRVQKSAQIGSTPAKSGMPVNMNDVITTGPGARLQITFRDETLLTLGENARVVIDRFVYDPGSSTGVLALNAGQGALRFATGKLGKMSNKDVTVTTPNAALAVRGTEFWGGFIDLQYGVLLLSGEVDVSNSVGAVTLANPGEGTDIPPPLKDEYGPLEPYIWPADKVARALAMTSFGLALGPAQTIGAGLLIGGAIAGGIAAGQDDGPNRRPRPVSP